MSSYAFIYVAGFDLDDVPIGFWSMYSIELIKSICPPSSSNSPGFCLKIPLYFKREGYNISFTKVVFPLP